MNIRVRKAKELGLMQGRMLSRRDALRLGALAGAAAALSACGGGGGGDEAPAANAAEPTATVPANTPTPLPQAAITVTDAGFEPKELTVKENTLVVWTWKDTTQEHNVLLSGLASTKQASGKFERKFPAGQGTFNYQCGVHPTETGKIIVA